MRKHWIALLSLLGVASSGPSANAQVIKGSQPNPAQTNDSTNKVNKSTKAATNEQKLQVKQDTLRQQNKGTVSGGKQADTMTPSAYCKGNQQLTKANGQLTPPPPGQANKAILHTRANAQPNGNNNAITKGNQNNALTKGNNQQITKGNQQLTKANNQAITKGNQQLTKGNNQAITKANVPK